VSVGSAAAAVAVARLWHAALRRAPRGRVGRASPACQLTHARLVLCCAVLCCRRACARATSNPTPSLSAAIINHFKMPASVINYSLGGMGCSAGVIALDMARELLSLHPNKVALVVSHENITNNFYIGVCVCVCVCVCARARVCVCVCVCARV
jgi:hypothetical protein